MSDLKKLLAHELAYIFGVNRRTVSRWAKNDGLPKNADGSFDVAACVAWAMDRLEARAADEAEKPQPGSEWLSEYRRVRFLREELALKRERGELIPRDEVQAQRMALTTYLVSSLNNLAPRCAPVVAGKTDRHEIEAALSLEIAALLRVLAGGQPYNNAAADTAIAEMGNLSPKQALGARSRAERCMPLHMRYDARAGVFTDQRNGLQVPAAEASEYVRRFPNHAPPVEADGTIKQQTKGN